MEGAASLLAALVLAQAVSLPYPRRRWLLRTGTALLLTCWVLLPGHGAWAPLYALPPLAIWVPAHLALTRRQASRVTASVSELLYLASATTWVAVLDASARQRLLDGLAISRSPAVVGIAALYLLGIFGGERLVRSAIAPFLRDLPPADRTALPRAGRVIGWAERFLVITLIAGSYGEPVGWLLAAKTAMRYPEIKEEATGRLSEYFFVGTLLSLSIGVGVGLAVRWLMTRAAL